MNVYNISDIQFIVVNTYDYFSIVYRNRLSSLGDYEFVQDIPHSSIWHKLNGAKDDFLIYDRCGQLTYHISLPYSDLRHQFIELAINATYDGYHPCNCSVDPGMHLDTTIETATTMIPDVNEVIGPEYDVSGITTNKSNDIEVEFGGDPNTEQSSQTGTTTPTTTPTTTTQRN